MRIGVSYIEQNRLERFRTIAVSCLQGVRARWKYLFAHPAFRQSRILTLFRLLRWRFQCALGIPATIRLPLWGAQMYLPPRGRGGGTTMIFAVRCRYEKELLHLDRFISPGMVVVDGGASCGIYTIAAAKLVGSTGKVFSFEPAVETFSILRKNIDLNRLENVRAYRAALSDTDGKAVFYHNVAGPNGFSLGCPRTPGLELQQEEVATYTLGRLAQEEGVQRIGLIKLDVEGAEELALRGAGRLIARVRPTINFEFNRPGAQQMGLDSLGSWNLLKGLGYTFSSLEECGDLRPLDHPPGSDEIINVIATHHGNRK